MKSALNKNLIILLVILALYICGSVATADTKNNSKPSKNPEVKLPEFKNINFSEDEKKFFVWFNKYFPDRAYNLQNLEKKPKIYHDRFKNEKSSFRRLWKGYKQNKKYGEALVAEVKLRLERNEILDKLKNEKNNEKKRKLRDKLNEIVSKEFDSAVAIKRIRYEWLRTKIEQLEKELAKRENEVKKLVENKDQEVKNRTEDLIKGEEKINWE